MTAPPRTGGLLPPMPRTWWLRSAAYRRFAARELTSVFVLAFTVVMLLFLLALSRGPRAYGRFLGWLGSAGAMALFAAILAAGLYHTLTWFRLSAQVQVVRVRGRVVPRGAVAATLTAAWLAVSAGVAYVHVWW
ncbi:MAG: fumarate reductase subunit C [Actinomycetota bacterium]